MCTETKQPHKHAELIIAWAKGAKIEYRQSPDQKWSTRNTPHWHPDFEYRIKPEPKPDVIVHTYATIGNISFGAPSELLKRNIQCLFDGETGKLKSVSLL